MGGGKRGTTGEAAGGKAGRRRAGVAADELDRRKPAGRGNAARPGGMALVDPWGALLAGLLVAEEPSAEERAAEDAGGVGKRGGGGGRWGGRPPGPAGGR